MVDILQTELVFLADALVCKQLFKGSFVNLEELVDCALVQKNSAEFAAMPLHILRVVRGERELK